VQVDRVAAVDHGGHLAEPVARLRTGGAGAVDQLVGVTYGEEPGARVEIATLGDGDLERVRWFAPGHPGRLPGRRPDQQAGIVRPDRRGADQDGVAAGPDLVDPVEIGVVGEQESLVAGLVHIAVDGHSAAQQHVRTLNHR
jgi:hypothetical protein